MMYPLEREMLMELLDIPCLEGLRDESGKTRHSDEEIIARDQERFACVRRWNVVRDERFPGWRERAIEQQRKMK